MLTTEQQNVFDWLNDTLQVPVFAEAYKGALDLLDKKPPGYITFVAHTGRDIMNLLARTITRTEGGLVQYCTHVNKLQAKWQPEWGDQGLTTSDNAQMGHLIPYDICQIIKDLIADHETGQERENMADSLFFRTFLDYDDKDRIPQNFLKEWKAAKKWFVAHTHLRKKRFDGDAPSEVAKHFQTLDGLLYVAASSEFKRIKGIHEILEETNG